MNGRTRLSTSRRSFVTGVVLTYLLTIALSPAYAQGTDAGCSSQIEKADARRARGDWQEAREMCDELLETCELSDSERRRVHVIQARCYANSSILQREAEDSFCLAFQIEEPIAGEADKFKTVEREAYQRTLAREGCRPPRRPLWHYAAGVVIVGGVVYVVKKLLEDDKPKTEPPIGFPPDPPPAPAGVYR